MMMMMPNHNNSNNNNNNNNNNGGRISMGSVDDDSSSPSLCGGGGGGGGNNGGGSLKKGPWTAAEDTILMEYVKKHGEGNWNAVQKNSGLSRCGKSCRLRWANHLRPNLKKGSFSPEEEILILDLHAKLGNKWARMAAQLPGRTDNEIKNYWNTRIKRRQRAGLPLYPQQLQKQSANFHLNNRYEHQFHPSNPPPPPPELQSQQFSFCHKRKLDFNSPLSVFDPISISASNPLPLNNHQPTTFLPSQYHEFKRYKNNNGLGFSQFSTQNHSPQFQYNPSNYDLNTNPILQTPFEPDGLISSNSHFSMKPELPLIQLSQLAANTATSGITDDFKLSRPLLASQSSNSGLLDALLQGSQAMTNSEDVKREANSGLDDQLVDEKSVVNGSTTIPSLGSSSQLNDLNSASFSFGSKMKEEAKDENNPVDDDLSGLLDIIPSTMSMTEWGTYTESTGEISTEQQSSDVTEADIDWTLNTWNNMPGIC